MSERKIRVCDACAEQKPGQDYGDAFVCDDCEHGHERALAAAAAEIGVDMDTAVRFHAAYFEALP
jgi:hypothetical protein